VLRLFVDRRAAVAPVTIGIVLLALIWLAACAVVIACVGRRAAATPSGPNPDLPRLDRRTSEDRSARNPE
jgi:hypothetical protein